MANKSARKARKYPIEAEEALLRLHFREGHSKIQAARLIAQGRGGCPAVEFGDYAYKIIKRRGEQFETTDEVALRRAIDMELHKLAVNMMRQARRLNAAGEVDPDKVRRMAIALRTVRAELAKPEKPKAPEPEPVGPNDVLGGLLKLAKTNGATT